MDTVAGLETNTLADGFFHLAMAARRRRDAAARQGMAAGSVGPPWRTHLGLLVAGWGAFNLVEGLIDHQLLGIHPVRDDLGAPLGWDLAFLAFGILLGAAGVAMTRSGETIAAQSTGLRVSDRRHSRTP
jgi:uncharacterized membrane protein